MQHMGGQAGQAQEGARLVQIAQQGRNALGAKQRYTLRRRGESHDAQARVQCLGDPLTDVATADDE